MVILFAAVRLEGEPRNVLIYVALDLTDADFHFAQNTDKTEKF